MKVGGGGARGGVCIRPQTAKNLAGYEGNWARVEVHCILLHSGFQ